MRPTRVKRPSHETLGIIERTSQDDRTCDINKGILCTSPKIGIEYRPAGKLFPPKNDRNSHRPFSGQADSEWLRPFGGRLDYVYALLAYQPFPANFQLGIWIKWLRKKFKSAQSICQGVLVARDMCNFSVHLRFPPPHSCEPWSTQPPFSCFIFGLPRPFPPHAWEPWSTQTFSFFILSVPKPFPPHS